MSSSQIMNFRTDLVLEKKVKVGVLGATGAVGQRFLQYLEGHPWFEVIGLGASERSAGKLYHEATQWQLGPDFPSYVRNMRVDLCTPEAFGEEIELVFSALDAPVAGDVEIAFRDAGIAVFSNAKNYRMTTDVPLVVPPVNGDHIELVRDQVSFKTSGGFIVTNANCSSTGMVIALKPINDAFKIKKVVCTTLQAISGAGYPGLPSLDILDNVVPFISGEEDKLETEYKKILGSYTVGEGKIDYLEFPLSASVNRVHVRDGHSISLSIEVEKPPSSLQEVEDVLASYRPDESLGGVSSLPSAPTNFIVVRSENNRPQPRLDRDTGCGYTTVVGRIRPDPVFSFKMQVLSHNTVMGAAGSSILNAELAFQKNLIPRRN